MLRFNVITGFLGAGKTSLIRNLLTSRPVGERWAVLVNEFGEVGIDGSLLQGDENNVVIKEVPGGCVCCAAGLPFQIALNQLIRKVRPQRLLIEPTGLGHPREIIKLLTLPGYEGVLQRSATLTLVDSRKLANPRYSENSIFNDQIAVADVVLAAKADTYSARELDQLRNYLDAHGKADTAIEKIVNAGCKLNFTELDAMVAHYSSAVADTELEFFTQPLLELQLPFNEQGFLRRSRSDDGYHVSGWVFRPALEFDADKLFALFSGVDCERLKAVMITDDGIISYNLVDGVLQILHLDECDDSRVEIIGVAPVADSFESYLLSALL